MRGGDEGWRMGRMRAMTSEMSQLERRWEMENSGASLVPWEGNEQSDHKTQRAVYGYLYSSASM